MKKKIHNTPNISSALTLSTQIEKSLTYIRSKTKLQPDIAIILGSGLGHFTNLLTDQISIDTASIPYYPHLTVEGHRGQVVFGTIGNTTLLVFQGRVHCYETGNIETTLYPIRIARALGITTLIVTNAAGGVNENFQAGDLMLITDQINLTFENPLKDNEHRTRPTDPDKSGQSFVQVSNIELYNRYLRDIITKVAQEKSIDIQRGIYCGVLGPSYETAAEIEMIRRIGGEAVGMSTVNEVSLAVALGMRVAGVSCITNMATGISSEKLSHAEVTKVASKVQQQFASLLTGAIQHMPKT